MDYTRTSGERMEFRRAGQWIPCRIVAEIQFGYIVAYTWQDVPYQRRVGYNLVRKAEK